MRLLDRVLRRGGAAAPPEPAEVAFPDAEPAAAPPPAAPAADASPYRKPLPKREADYVARYLCPGCARYFLLPRAPPVGTLCPPCRRAGRAPRFRPCSLCGSPFAPAPGSPETVPCRACEAHFRGAGTA